MMEQPQFLSIKNMVCPRCLEAVQQIAENVGIPVKSIHLGSVVLAAPISQKTKENFALALKNGGFELLEDYKAKTIEEIKKLIIQQVYTENSDEINKSLVSLLKGHIPYEYSYLSKLFSSVEGLTLEKFAVKQKIERAKELLIYEEHNLAQIAESLGFNSGAYLSTLFKKELGMTPTAFKNLRNPAKLRKSIDQL